MTDAAREVGFVPRRLHLVLAIDRLLVRLLQAAPGRWVRTLVAGFGKAGVE